MLPLDPVLIFVLVLLLPIDAVFFTWLILKAATFPPPTMLVIVLSAIAIVCLVGYLIIGKDRADLIAIGSACVGALTTMLSRIGRSLEDHGGQPPFPVEREDSDGDGS